MGALAETVGTPSELEAAFRRAKAADRTSVIVMKVDPHEGWTERGHAWWEVGVPEVSDSEAVHSSRAAQEKGRARQRRGV